MEIKKNDLYTVEITDMTDDGSGIGKVDGYTLFIKDALVGDLAKVKVIKTKKRYGYGRLMEIVKPSPNRVDPPCPAARSCGGCQIQQMSYPAQLAWKQKRVSDLLERIGGIRDYQMLPILGMDRPWRFRNKAQYPVGRGRDGKAAAGFYALHSHNIISCGDCLLQDPRSIQAMEICRRWIDSFGISIYDEKTGRGLIRHILTRTGAATGQIMVCLVTNGEGVPQAEDRRRADKNRDGRTSRGRRNDQAGKDVWGVLSDRLMALPGVTTVVQNLNRERTNVILGKETRVLAGPGFITDTIGDTEFEISAQSFYQVNPVQTEVLYGTALKYAGLTGKENVWDLYCGIGTISLFMAKQAKKVYGDEIVPQAIEDARRNAVRNGIGNAEFFVGKAEEVLPAWYAEQQRNPEAAREKIDVICVDPPRKGCDEACLQTMLQVAPERIVYVSCDSATLARDLKYLLADGRYTLTDVQPVDMFPQTVHIETVCLLSKLSEVKNHISVKVDMNEMDLTAAESKATYQEIKEWVKEKYGFHVSHLNIAKTKRKCGIIERKNYNLPKNEDSRSPETPKEKEEAITEAFRHFQMI